jgi:peptide/nickel transport system ATP-binding protein
MSERPLLDVRALHLSLPDRSRARPFRRPPLVDILKAIDFRLMPGEALGVVGESGSGKTSLGRTLVRLYRPTGGSIVFQGRDITHLDEAALRPLRGGLQMIFQDPQSALNPRHRIGDILAQPLLAFRKVDDARSAAVEAARLLERVGLPTGFARRYPHELSGGQRQRVGIARAIALQPALVVADEIVSGLDVSNQAQILDLLAELRRDMGLALIFVSHDLSVVRVVCDRVLVLLRGEVVESGPCAEMFASPRHEYTRDLLAAIPLPEVEPDWLN